MKHCILLMYRWRPLCHGPVSDFPAGTGRLGYLHAQLQQFDSDGYPHLLNIRSGFASRLRILWTLYTCCYVCMFVCMHVCIYLCVFTGRRLVRRHGHHHGTYSTYSVTTSSFPARTEISETFAGSDVHTHIHTYIHIYIHIYIHTYIHSYIKYICVLCICLQVSL